MGTNFTASFPHRYSGALCGHCARHDYAGYFWLMKITMLINFDWLLMRAATSSTRPRENIRCARTISIRHRARCYLRCAILRFDHRTLCERDGCFLTLLEACGITRMRVHDVCGRGLLDALFRECFSYLASVRAYDYVPSIRFHVHSSVRSIIYIYI